MSAYGWAVDSTPAPKHAWGWGAKPQSDPVKTANARKIALACGTATLGRIYGEDGLDYEDEIVVMAAEYGVTVEEMRVRLLDSNMQKTGGAQQPPSGNGKEKSKPNPTTKAQSRFTVPPNGNGSIHGVLA